MKKVSKKARKVLSKKKKFPLPVYPEGEDIYKKEKKLDSMKTKRN